MQNISNSDYRVQMELAGMNHRLRMMRVPIKELGDAFAALNGATKKASIAFENYKASCSMLSKYSFKADRMLERMRAFANPQKQ